MKLEIVSGQCDIVLNDIFTSICKENGIDTGLIECDNFLIFPELISTYRHPKRLYDYVRAYVQNNIVAQRDTFILTYSDHVLNAVRVEVKRNNFRGAKCHQFLNDGTDIVAHIMEDGRLDVWVEDIFDVWDQAVAELVL